MVTILFFRIGARQALQNSSPQTLNTRMIIRKLLYPLGGLHAWILPFYVATPLRSYYFVAYYSVMLILQKGYIPIILKLC